MMKQTPPTEAAKEVRVFLDTLFEPRDLIEIRAVETWSSDTEKSQSRVIGRMWCEAVELPRHWSELEAWNRLGGNVFFSVNPRSCRGGVKNSVTTCHSVWVDIDDISVEDASGRFEAAGILPSITVNSGGHGVHAYWKLARAIDVRDPVERAKFERVVKSLAKEVGGDSTSDVTRMLRLPGTRHAKNFRNGRRPTSCFIADLNPSRLYDVSDFERFLPPQSDTKVDRQVEKLAPLSLATASLGQGRDRARIQGVLRYLEREDVEDRSRRDFGAILMLIQCGLSQAEIRSLVMSTSKFRGSGERYFQLTYDAALRSLGR